MLLPTTTHFHPFHSTSTHSHPLLPTPNHSHSLSPTPIQSHSFTGHYRLLPLFFGPLPFIFSSLLPVPIPVYSTPTHFKPTSAHVQSLSPLSSSQSTYSHPTQPITYHSNPYLVLMSYVSTCSTYLRAYIPSCVTCPYAYVIHFYALYCLCIYALRARMCVNTSKIFIYTAYFETYL